MTVELTNLEIGDTFSPPSKNDLVLPQMDLNNNNNYPTKKSAEQLCIRVTQQPSQTFYKDEGGKSNHLTVSVVIAFFNNNTESGRKKKSLPLGNIAIKPKLIYETGKDVEDADEIFNILAIEPKVVTSSEQPVLVKFRIEKVSRRKDGKKFKLAVDIDYEKSVGYKAGEIRGVSTNSIMVLSKRKLSISSNTSAPPKSTPKKKLKQDSDDEKMSMSTDFIKDLKKTVERLEHKVTTLNERVSVLESENETMRMHMKRENSLELAENRSYEAYGDNFVKRSAYISPHTSRIFSKELSDEYFEFDEDMLKPLTKTKSNSELMSFDFGIPSAQTMF